MATVTGLTADRMIAMENATVISGEIDPNGNLILTTRDGTPIDAGSAIGPIGPEGPPGPGPIVGEVRMTILTAVPLGWLVLNGQTIIGADTLYSALWAVAPASWKSGSNLVLPDVTRRHLIGASNNAPGEVGGDDFIRLLTPNLPSHTHADGSLTTASAGGHSHEPSNPAYNFVIHHSGTNDWPSGSTTPSTLTGSTYTGTTSIAGAHVHNVTGNTAATGSGTPYEHRPQYMTVNTMIFAGY